MISLLLIESFDLQPVNETRIPTAMPTERFFICVNLDIIRIDLGEVGWRDVDWIGLAQDRNRWSPLENSVLNLRVHEILGNYRWPLS
jgi:hypothetical protein